MTAIILANILFRTPMAPILSRFPATEAGVIIQNPVLLFLTNAIVVEGVITGEANAPACDPNQPWLETIGASTATSNASTAPSQRPQLSSSVFQSFLSSSVGPSASAPSSQDFASTNLRSSSVGSGSGSRFFTSLFRSHATYTGTALSGSSVMGSSAYISTTGALASSRVLASDSSAFPSSSNSLSTQTSQASYVNPNPLGCQTIM